MIEVPRLAASHESKGKGLNVVRDNEVNMFDLRSSQNVDASSKDKERSKDYETKIKVTEGSTEDLARQTTSNQEETIKMPSYETQMLKNSDLIDPLELKKLKASAK